MEEWHEVCPFRSSLTAQLSQKAIYPPKVAVPQETTALVFDTKQELVWAGNRQVSPLQPEQRLNEQGRVIGFAGLNLTSYTSFFAHVDEVRDFLGCWECAGHSSAWSAAMGYQVPAHRTMESADLGGVALRI